MAWSYWLTQIARRTVCEVDLSFFRSQLLILHRSASASPADPMLGLGIFDCDVSVARAAGVIRAHLLCARFQLSGPTGLVSPDFTALHKEITLDDPRLALPISTTSVTRSIQLIIFRGQNPRSRSARKTTCQGEGYKDFMVPSPSFAVRPLNASISSRLFIGLKQGFCGYRYCVFRWPIVARFTDGAPRIPGTQPCPTRSFVIRGRQLWTVERRASGRLLATQM